MKNTPISRKDGIVVQEANSELLIYDLNRNKALCLNDIAAAIWLACDGNRDISALTNHVSEKFEHTVSDEYIWLALDHLKKENLLENNNGSALDFTGFSRREAIKKIGMTSMAALPVITSLVAPTAIHAQSVCGACQCSGLLAPVSVCPPNFADCPQICGTCNIPQGGCFSVEGVVACNGTCGGPVGPTCPPSSPGSCTCFGNFGIGQTCPGVQCPGGCTSCRVTQTCVTQEVGPPACNGVCQ